MGWKATAILNAVKQADPAMGTEFENALKANSAFENYLDNLQDPSAWGEELKSHATPANAPAFKEVLSDISQAGVNGTNFDFSQLDAQNMAATVTNYNTQLAQTQPPSTSGPSTASGGQTYSELKKSLIKAGQTDLAQSLDHAGQDFQNSLMYALNENPHFGPYLLQSMTSSNGVSNGASSFLTNTLDELFIKDKNGNRVPNPEEPGTMMLDNQKAQVVTNILHEIGNGDLYQDPADFKLLDDVAAASQKLDAVKTTNDAQKIKNATHDYYLALNAAGGHLPALATLEFSDIMNFISDLFDPNKSMDLAISNLVDNLGLDPSSAQAADVQQIGGMMGGFLRFFGGEPGSGGYGDLIRNITNDEYGFGDSIRNISGMASRAYNGAAVGQTDQALNNAATVPVVDDVKFSTDVENHLRGLPTPNVGNVFDAMRNASPGGAANEELHVLEKAVNEGKLELTGDFKDALARQDFAKIGDITNDLYNELEDGDSPAVAANQSHFALTATP
jgi:hypothetical protein